MSWSARWNSMRERLARHFGRRGSFLTLFGVLWTFIGIGVSASPLERFSEAGPTGPLQFLDDGPWSGMMWMIFGLIALVVGLFRRRVGNRDEWGFNSLLIPPMVWSGAYLWSWITFCITDGEYGRDTGWVGCLVFLIAVFAILVVSGWPDPSDELRETA